MINLKKQVWRTGALCLAGVVALSVTGVSVYAKTSEKKETEVKEQIRDAVDDIWKSEDTSAASIDETVYVILNADGTVSIPEVLRMYMGGKEKLVPKH
jgi:hypothetical protein